MPEPRRRRIEVVLGLLWLLDGGLQFQPYMFTKAFMGGVLGMANMGLPRTLADADYHLAGLLAAHPAPWNAVFATAQVAIGVGLLVGRGRSTDVARGASVLWAVAVWLLGEGAGGMFMGGISLLTGAPGAALLYAVVAATIWPPRFREGLARAAWAAVWAGSGLLELVAVNHAASVPGAQITDGSFGEPGALAALNRSIGHALAGDGRLFATTLLVAAVAIGAGVLWEPTRRPAVIAGAAVAVFVAVLGQDLGQVFTGHGTDPGTGPLLALMAFSLWPARTGQPAPAPTPVATNVRSGTGRVPVAATVPD